MSTPPTLSDNLARIVEGLRRAVAGEGLARGLAGPFIILVCARLQRLVARFAAATGPAMPAPRLPAKLPAASQLPARLKLARGAPGASGDGPAPNLPRRFAWLLRAVPGSAAFGAQLRHLLADPEMVALLEMRPAAGRALRPLCAMLGIRPPACLRLPPRPRAPRRRPARPRPPAPPSREPAIFALAARPGSPSPDRPSPDRPLPDLPPLDLSAWTVPPGHYAYVWPGRWNDDTS